MLLHAAGDGAPLARVHLEPDAAQVRPFPGVPPQRVAAEARRDLAGLRLDTPDEPLVAALVAGGLRMHRAATELRHDLADLPMPAPLPSGWSLATPGWDDDLHDALVAAYGPGHPDGAWRDDHTAQVRAMFDDGGPVPPLLPASARVVGPDGRSAGHVLSTGPAPDRPYGWVVNLGVAPRAQGRGLGRALLTHALYGTRTADLPALALQVADGNSARRLYDAAGFRPVSRMFSVRLPASADLPDRPAS
ncbi:GNAT family N-acetyltransferase [Micromonospora olivasterospora]|uniref:Acetyltransferase (GNAT) family protein n=1 Tax=Micromonospora olivasterospora TaxID=1880 RepID=A0A562I8E8_MICOL|nr:GNAT family N-acetyltransferase [Micromonospora olivasterospora]TWH67086.1 acetyltransferase (GNAT) family protein [Micromonospora olivasterospora]